MNQRLSIVIIGRNEEKGIAHCVSAAKAAAAQIGGAEMIFVDSASTDGTTEIVESLGVRVIRLDASLKLSPSAGRYVGSLHASAEYVLFIDADTHVYRDFLPDAIARLDACPHLAGVNGRIDDLNETGEIIDGVEERYAETVETKWLRGPSCLYRRTALIEAGSFNPYLAVEEEAELGLRLWRAGWRLELIPVPMGCHTRCFHHQSLTSIMGAFRRDIAVGRIGELTRTAAYAFRAGNGLEFCWLRLNTTLIFLAWLVFGGVCLLVQSGWNAAWIFGAVSVTGMAAVWLKKRSVRQALVFLPAKALCLVDLIAGANKLDLKDPTAYLGDRTG